MDFVTVSTGLILPYWMGLPIRYIHTIHSYNRRRVKEEDVPKYGKVVGTGTLIIGISLVLGFIVSFWSEEIMGYIILPAIIIGLGLILYGQFKYNKGIF